MRPASILCENIPPTLLIMQCYAPPHSPARKRAVSDLRSGKRTGSTNRTMFSEPVIQRRTITSVAEFRVRRRSC